MNQKQIRDILARGFATIDVDMTTGKRKDTIVNGHKVTTGFHFLADFEIENIINELSK